LFGGYPINIIDGKIEMDLPAGVTLEEAIAFNESSMPVTGIERWSSPECAVNSTPFDWQMTN
jgi:hypothetical protein